MYIYNLFNKHPNELNMTYFQHALGSLSLSINFLIASVQAFIHAFFPFVFQNDFERIYVELLVINNQYFFRVRSLVND